MPRFVILRHEVDKGLSRTHRSHFDWMFETDIGLATWSTETNPLDCDDLKAGFSVPVERLADHRAAYLDFEGEISGGRGTVSRIVGGTFHRIDESADRFEAELTWADDAKKSHQRILLIERLRNDAAGSWRLRLSGLR